MGSAQDIHVMKTPSLLNTLYVDWGMFPTNLSHPGSRRPPHEWVPYPNMKAPSVKNVNRLIAASGWMLLIFIGSTDVLSAAHTSHFVLPSLLWLHPQISIGTIATIHFALRKLGHLTEYAILATLLWCALRSTFASTRSIAITMLVFLASAVFAASDELHQSFVPTRTASIKDVMIDIGGAAIALSLCFALRRRRRPARTWDI